MKQQQKRPFGWARQPLKIEQLKVAARGVPENGAATRLKQIFEIWEWLSEAGERISAPYEAGVIQWKEYKAAQDALGTVSERMHAMVDEMREILPRSVRGLAAKARVADLLMRDENGETHSEGWQS